jgi:hypothetical protein
LLLLAYKVIAGKFGPTLMLVVPYVELQAAIATAIPSAINPMVSLERMLSPRK